ncbi:MAG: DsbA family oxidoreductase [Patulibacter sp.]|nr:DsbA family oxidoreductase [Patulibacter sp.]
MADAPAGTRPIALEVWSDVACPFCYIGKRNLEAALDRFAHRDDVSVVWRSFQLDPAAPVEPQGDMYDMLAAKFGGSREDAKAKTENVVAMAAQSGLTYDMDAARPSNTFDAHRMIHLAASLDRQDAMNERLLAAYFTEGAVLADHATLRRLAVEVGLPAERVDAALAGDEFADAVRHESEEAQQLGLGGVPAFVFDRRGAIAGAQPPEVLLSALEQLHADA